MLVILEFQAVRIGDVRANLVVFVVASLFIILLNFKRIALLSLRGSPLLFLFYVLWCAISSSWSFIGLESAAHALPILMVLLCAMIFKKVDPVIIARVFIRFGLFLLIVCWVMLVAVPAVAVLPDVVWRLNGPFAHAQRLALFSSAVSLALVVSWFNRQAWIKFSGATFGVVSSVSFLIAFITIAATQARAFSAFFLLALYLVMLFGLRGWRKSIAIFIGITGFLIIVVLGEQILAFFSRGDVMDSSLTGRVPTWLYSIDLIYSNPWFGYGFGSFFSDLTVNPDREYVSPHAHNTWINAAVETGVIGAAILTLYLFFVLFEGIKYQAVTRRLSVALYLCIFIIFCGATGVVVGGKVSTLMGILLLFNMSEQYSIRSLRLSRNSGLLAVREIGVIRR